jgi:hypothetical protein
MRAIVVGLILFSVVVTTGAMFAVGKKREAEAAHDDTLITTAEFYKMTLQKDTQLRWSVLDNAAKDPELIVLLEKQSAAITAGDLAEVAVAHRLDRCGETALRSEPSRDAAVAYHLRSIRRTVGADGDGLGQQRPAPTMVALDRCAGTRRLSPVSVLASSGKRPFDLRTVTRGVSTELRPPVIAFLSIGEHCESLIAPSLWMYVAATRSGPGAPGRPVGRAAGSARRELPVRREVHEPAFGYGTGFGRSG